MPRVFEIVIVPIMNDMVFAMARITFQFDPCDDLARTTRFSGRAMRSTFALLMLCAIDAFAQSGPILVGLGYRPPATIFVAPRQIIRFDIVGLKTVLPFDTSTATRELRAVSLPLPEVLARISLTLRQRFFMAGLQVGETSVKLPMIAIRQLAMCADNSTSQACIRSTITAQIPFDLSFLGIGTFPTDITISEAGVDSPPFGVGAVSDAIHVVTTCDQEGTSCDSIVAHPDGSRVTPDSPANPGEVVVVYAWGLGSTTPAAQTGAPAPAPAPVLGPPGPGSDVVVGFDFRSNAGPSNPTSMTSHVPVYLTPGQVGLYQINVQLPDSFPNVEGCSNITGVSSNLTINFRRSASFDGAGLCVKSAL